MDTVFLIVGFLTIALGGISMYTPWIQLKHSKRLTGKELSKMYPEHKWMRWGYITLYISWVVIVFFLFTKVLITSINIFSSMAAIFANIGLFIGLFAVVTGVSILPTKAPVIIFVVGDEAKDAGRFQVTWSASVLLLAIALEFLRRFL